MKKIMWLFSVVFIFALPSCEKDEQPAGATDFDKEILNIINTYRKSKGLVALEYNLVIWKEANIHSKNMAAKTVPFGHDGFYDRVEKILADLGGGNGSAENVAYGYPTAQEVVDGWLSSAGHKANIEGNYTLSALSAVMDKDGTYYYTQIFIKK